MFEVSNIVSLVLFTPGRMIRALGLMLIALARRPEKFSALRERIEAAIEQARATRELEHQFAVAQNRPRGNAKVFNLDVQVDKAVVGIRDILEAYASTSNVEMASLAQSMLEELFPNGVTAITQATFVEEHSLVVRLVADLRGKHAPSVKKLGFGPMVEELAKVTKAYGDAQNEEPDDGVDFSQVRAARRRSQEMLLEVVAIIVGRFPSGNAEDHEGRRALLGPIMKQQEAIRSYTRSRRAAPDIDPDTGEPTDPPAPAVAPATDVAPPVTTGGTPPVEADDLQPAFD